MIIKFYWPNYPLPDKGQDDMEIDSYWLECSLKEAEQEVFPFLLKEQIEESKKLKLSQNKDTFGIETGELCFLVAKDLSSIQPFSWYYPYSHMWNAYSPFRDIGPWEITRLKEIPILDATCKLQISKKPPMKELKDQVKKSDNKTETEHKQIPLIDRWANGELPTIRKGSVELDLRN